MTITTSTTMRHLATACLVSLVLILASCGHVAYAQQDITVNGRGPYVDLGRGLKWTGSGAGAINNNFLFSPLSPDLGTCVFVANTDVSLHTFALAVYHTGDPRKIAFGANTAAWVQDGSTMAAVTFGSGNAGATLGNYYPPSGAARMAVSITGGTGSGAADVYVVQTTAAACSGQFNQITSASGCKYQAFTISGAGYQNVVTNSSSTKSIHVCYLSMGMGAATNIFMASGTGGICASPSTVAGTWVAQTQLTMALENMSLSFGTGNDVCINQSAAATSGGVIGISIY
jgi:hypothetical protein